MKKHDTSLEDIAESIADLSNMVGKQFEQVGKQFEQVGKQFEQVDKRFDAMDNELRAIRTEQREMRVWLESIDRRLLGVESDIKEIYDRIVALEENYTRLTKKELKELETKLAKMIDWAKLVSQKTGVALPKL